MDTDSGVDSGTRNIGRFFLSLIPWSLGLGFTVWLTAWISVERYKSAVEQQRRSAMWVGAAQLPTKPIEIIGIVHDCTAVTRADLSGQSLVLYAVSNCRETENYTAWYWTLLSPDGTIIGSGYTNMCPVLQRFGDKAECTLKVSDDQRGARLRVWTQRSP